MAFLMNQKWKNVFFMHWSVPADQLRPHIPSRLNIDTYQGQAWISIVVFDLAGIYVSKIKMIPSFPEINVRTYVTYDGQPGVYFLALDAKQWTTYTFAKRLFHLPYYKSYVSFTNVESHFHVICKRQDKRSEALRFSATLAAQPEKVNATIHSLDDWLTERYCFYCTNAARDLLRGKIEHKRWPLQRASGYILNNELFRPYALSIREKIPLMHYAEEVHAAFKPLERLD